MPTPVRIEFKNMNQEPQGYFVGYLKGKRKKYCEQKERYRTPEEALMALGIPIIKIHVSNNLKPNA